MNMQTPQEFHKHNNQQLLKEKLKVHIKRELDLGEYKSFSPHFEEDVYAITVEASLAARNVIGGTAPRQVEQALANAKKLLV